MITQRPKLPPAVVSAKQVRPEARSRSRLPCSRVRSVPSRILHGLERERAFDLWLREGGVAITSYDTFRTMGRKGRIPPVALR